MQELLIGLDEEVERFTEELPYLQKPGLREHISAKNHFVSSPSSRYLIRVDETGIHLGQRLTKGIMAKTAVHQPAKKEGLASAALAKQANGGVVWQIVRQW